VHTVDLKEAEVANASRRLYDIDAECPVRGQLELVHHRLGDVPLGTTHVEVPVPCARRVFKREVAEHLADS